MMMCDRNAPGPISPAQHFASSLFVTDAPMFIVAAISEALHALRRYKSIRDFIHN